ncbi:MAG: DNA repair protein RecN [Gammaproteobacteria bacterium]|nr:DNA repair protein RecN [Gammaproteobacteria bacterium]
MLTHLSVRDLAIVDSLSVEFGPGLTVLTGETGAGKSILIDALSLTLGARSNAQMVRQGQSRAEVTALYDISTIAGVAQKLAALELNSADDDLHLRRTLSADGRSRAYINGQLVPVQMLKEVGAALVDIHGQHEHQSLTDGTVQRQLLDAYAGHTQLVDETGAAYDTLQARQEEYDALVGGAGDHEARQALLEYQVDELRELAPTAGEFEDCRQELAYLSRAVEQREDAGHALTALEDNDDVQRALALVSALVDKTPGHPLIPCRELLETAVIHVDEATTALRAFTEQELPDPERLAVLNERMEQLQNTARKHRTAPEALPDILLTLERELDGLMSASNRLGQLQDELAQAHTNYQEAAHKLSASRCHAAAALGEAISAHMQELGMPSGRCEVAITTVDDRIRRHGHDRVELKVAINPGASMQALARVASGGELSRVSLAVQVVLAGVSAVPTLIFDEVDVGVGGRVAEIVGKQLRTVAASRQVLCVTHLAQVACQGNGHLRVAKRTDGERVQTVLEQLDAKARIAEVARMLGGVEITKRTLAHAREMLKAGAR